MKISVQKSSTPHPTLQHGNFFFAVSKPPKLRREFTTSTDPWSCEPEQKPNHSPGWKRRRTESQQNPHRQKVIEATLSPIKQSLCCWTFLCGRLLCLLLDSGSKNHLVDLVTHDMFSYNHLNHSLIQHSLNL